MLVYGLFPLRMECPTKGYSTLIKITLFTKHSLQTDTQRGPSIPWQWYPKK